MTISSRQLRLVAAFAGLNVLLVVGGWIALVSPQRHDASTAAAQVQLAQNELNALKVGNSQGGSTKQPAINTSCVYKLDTALPSQANQSELLLELDTLANGAGVKIIGISPQPAQATATGYTVQPINLQLGGSYFQVTRFLHDLRTLVSNGHGCPVAKGPLFAASSVTFSSGQSNGDAPATVAIDAFYYGVTAGATPPVDTTATDTTTTTGS